MTDELTLDMLVKAKASMEASKLSPSQVCDKMYGQALHALVDSLNETAQVRAEMRKEIFIRDNEISHLKAQLSKLL